MLRYVKLARKSTPKKIYETVKAGEMVCWIVLYDLTCIECFLYYWIFLLYAHSQCTTLIHAVCVILLPFFLSGLWLKHFISSCVIIMFLVLKSWLVWKYMQEHSYENCVDIFVMKLGMLVIVFFIFPVNLLLQFL